MPGKRKHVRGPDEVFAAELKRVRDIRGWSQQRLADEMRKIGYPMDRSTIAKIERGHRPVSMQDSIALALALGVAPKALQLPHEQGAEIALTPNYPVDAHTAARWMRGHSVPVRTDARSIDLDALRVFEETMTFGEWWARRRPTVHQIVDYASALEMFSGMDEREWMRNCIDELEHAIKAARRELDREEQQDAAR
jgi:transcriptional regulator with XRE-family HTH domain